MLGRSGLHRVLAAVLATALGLATPAFTLPARAADDPAATAAKPEPAPSDAVQFPKGLRIGVVPPPGFTAAAGFAGFGDTEHQAGMAITELPAQAYYTLESQIFGKDNTAGIVVDHRELFAFASGIGFLVTAHQEADGVAYHRWLFVAGQPDFTAVIQAQVPVSEAARYPDAVMRAALASVTFRPPPVDEQLGMLPFKLDDLAGFHVERAIGEGLVVLSDGAEGAANRARMLVMIGNGAPETTSEYGGFAQQLLGSMPGLADFRLTDSESMRVGGRPGYEVRARARDVASGATLRLIQWLRFGGGGGYLRVVGVTSDQNWTAAFPRFRAVRDGVQFK